MKSPDRHTFCLAPWASVNFYTNGELVPCRQWHTSVHHENVNRSSSNRDQEKPIFFYNYDEYINSERMIETRKNQYNGVFVDSCNRCYEDERANKFSLRKVYNKTFSKHFDFKQINETFTVTEKSLNSVDFKLGNVCNLKCAMCFGSLSSNVQKECNNHKNKYQQLEFFQPVQLFENGDDISERGYYEWPESIEFANFFNRFKDQLKWISFTGGEPTVNSQIINLLNTIKQPELVTLSLTTNGSADIQRWIPILEKFKDVWINVSLEATHEQNKQIRFPSSWELITKNIAEYKKIPNLYLFVSHVLQSFSVKNLVELIRWCDTQDIKMNIMELTSPKYLTLNSVPTEEINNFREELTQLKSSKNQDIIDFALVFLSGYKYDSVLHQQRLRYLETLDSIRGTTLRKNYE